ncbi:MAG: peptide-methionine (S)-S-oxide reductase MsrA [Burkholderiaceae bacterium]
MNPTSWMRRFARVTAIGTLAALTACGLADAADRTYDLPNPAIDVPLSQAKGNQTLVLAGGCFWGVEAVFAHVKGVVSATSGYSGGDATTAKYDVVSSGRTGHAEAVKIVYDPSQVTVGQLLKVFFSVAHNPTELNRQGPDHGTQYRSAIFYKGDDQKRVVEAYVDQLQKAKIYSGPIVTQVTPLMAFYPAEDYHQNYLALHPNQPYIVINDIPKVEALKAKFPAMYRNG